MISHSSSPGIDKALVSSIQETAVKASLEAGLVLSRHFCKPLLIDKRLKHDLKLRVDRVCEEVIIDTIRARFPGHSVFSEECGRVPGTGDEQFLWIVDPLDGTVNYFHGVPFFCTSIACHHLGKGLCGVVYMPLNEELYVGVKNCGAWLNGDTLILEPSTDLAEELVGLGFTHKDGSMEYMSRILNIMSQRARKVRCFGATALDISQVAAGRLGAFLQRGTNLWDFAAAAIILEEAGGVVDAEEFIPGRWEILSCNQGLYSEIKKLMGEL